MSAGLYIWAPPCLDAQQVLLNPSPSRVIGHPQVPLVTFAPNLVEGREFNNPQSVAVDATSSPPILYVSDTGNHRILAWRNASQFANGAAADRIIGQRDRFSTSAGGPDTPASGGLNSPTGLAVDASGNLWIVDSGNNRILRFAKPFTQTEQLPDLALGQPGLNSKAVNQGGVSARSIALVGDRPLPASIVFDKQGNLYFADAGNHRVLRYPASVLGSIASSGPNADVVLGQTDFTSRTGLAINADNRLNKTRLNTPSGLAIDPSGRVYVSDALSRVLVFTSSQTGQAAARIMGVQKPQPAQPTDTTLNAPSGLFMIGNQPGVVDTGAHRLLIFPPFEQWSEESASAPSPRALPSGLLGQVDFAGAKPNRGQPQPSAVSFQFPAAATFSGSDLFVADSANNRVLAVPQSTGGLSVAARILGQVDITSNAVNLIEGREFFFNGSFGGFGGIVVDQTSDPPHLFVADSYNNRVLGFRDARGLKPGDRADLVLGQSNFFQSLINNPNNDRDKPTASSLYLPIGLALNQAGDLFVADSGNGRVLRFPKPFAQPAQAMLRADLVIGQRDFTTKVTDPTALTMRAPYGLAYTKDNGLLVSDASQNRVLFFEGRSGSLSNGMAASKVFGQADFSGTGPGTDVNRLNGPAHIAADSSSRLYVADTGNDRVLIFDSVSSPEVPTRDARARLGFRTTLRNQSSLSRPRGMFVSQATGEIWVGDTGANRVVRYPEYSELADAQSGVFGNFSLPSLGPVAVSLGAFNDLYVADSANRVGIHFPALIALNGASFLAGRPLSPGTIASACPPNPGCSPDAPAQFGSQTASINDIPNPLPLPKVLGGVQLLINNEPASLYYVSPRQINFLMPTTLGGAPAPTSGSVDVTVLRQSTGQILATGQVAMDLASPGIFTVDSTGNGQAAAINEDGSVNSPLNPAPRGTIVSLYLTGLGRLADGPPDGSPATGLVPTDVKPRVSISNVPIPEEDIQYAGLAPGLVGVSQINVRVPMSVPPSVSAVVIVVHKSVTNTDPSNFNRIRASIAVKQ